MADEIETTADGEELRGCPYCGAELHPGTYRCHDCGGIVALGWGTALKEHFLFLFASILIAVGCVSSWSTRFPVGATIPKTILVEAPAKPGAPPPAPNAEKVMIEETIQVAPVIHRIDGLQTIRGTFMFAIAIYGIFVAIFNVLFRRMIVWPFFMNGVLALWVGMIGLSRSMGSAAWESWALATKNGNFVEKLFGKWRAIPSGQLLLAFAGAIVLVSILKGVVGGFAAGAAKSKEKAASANEAAEARRAAREGKKKGDSSETPAS